MRRPNQLEEYVRASLHMLGRIALERALAIESSIREDVAAGRREPAILIMEHDPVYTVGRAGVRRAFPRGDSRRLPHVMDASTPVVEVDRGGDVTWHGPGQLIVHPVVPIKEVSVTLTGYLRQLEHAAIEALGDAGVDARRRDGLTGTWVGDAKVGFIGISCRKWVTYHGMSINVDCDLSAFESIVPCGIAECTVKSLAQLMDDPPSTERLGEAVARRLCDRLGLEASEELLTEEAHRA